jgi:two-component system, NtrC family, sensor histidine kinase KinB
MTDSTRSSLELLYNVSRELTSALDLHTVLTRVLSLSTTTIQAERGSVIVIDDHEHPVDGAIIVKGQLLPHTQESLISTVGQGLAGWVVRNRQAALIADTSLDKRWLRRPDDTIERSGPKSAICVPIQVRDELVGVLTLVHATPDFFGGDHLALLQAIADQAGIAVHNARLYESLQATNRRYHELFEDSIDPILVTNLEGKILEINRQAAQVSARTREELQGASIWDLHTVSLVWLQENIAAIHTGETVSCESAFQPRDSAPIPVEVYVHKISFAGEELLQWIIRDISERKQLDTLRDDLSAMIYHDLRSPLANIVSSLDMLRTLIQENGNDIVQQVLSIAIRSTERMQRLINSLLDINRLEAGQAITNRNAVEVMPLILEALDAVQPITSTKRLKVMLEVEANLPRIWIDDDMIRRVLINLLENATKFTPSEGKLIAGARRDGEWVRLWVQDTGPGIPSEAQNLIFNKFTRVPAERMPSSENIPKGLGLGLAFCKLAVQAHGGKIGVESEMGSGSCFYFTVPVTKEPV